MVAEALQLLNAVDLSYLYVSLVAASPSPLESVPSLCTHARSVYDAYCAPRPLSTPPWVCMRQRLALSEPKP